MDEAEAAVASEPITDVERTEGVPELEREVVSPDVTEPVGEAGRAASPDLRYVGAAALQRHLACLEVRHGKRSGLLRRFLVVGSSPVSRECCCFDLESAY